MPQHSPPQNVWQSGSVPPRRTFPPCQNGYNLREAIDHIDELRFLCESFDYLKTQKSQRIVAQERFLQERSLHGKEKKSLAYVIAIMNMILHGIEAPNIIHTDTLAENLADVKGKDRFDIIVAIRPSAAKSARKCSKTSPSAPAKPRSYLPRQHLYRRGREDSGALL